MDQTRKIANPASGQLNTKKSIFSATYTVQVMGIWQKKKKNMNCERPRTEKQPEDSNSEIIVNTIGLEKAVFLLCRINIKVRATFSHAFKPEPYKKWLNVTELEQKSIIRDNNVKVPTPF